MTRTLILLSCLLTATATAQDPVFKVQDQNGAIVLLILDDGTIQMPQGATNGFVLTTDANGNATWQPAPTGGSLTLPFSGIANTPSIGFEVINTGAGAAGRFTGNTGIGLVARSTSSTAISVPSTGNHGLWVGSAGGNGVHVAASTGLAGYFNGPVEVTGALTLPLGASAGHVLTSDASGNASWQAAPGGGLTLPFSGTTGVAGAAFSIENTDGNGGVFQSANGIGLMVPAAGTDGVRVQEAGTPSQAGLNTANNGFEVGGTEGNGLVVVHADQRGVFVGSAGSPSQLNTSLENNGFQVNGTEGHGLFVGRADMDGVRVASSGQDAGLWWNQRPAMACVWRQQAARAYTSRRQAAQARATPARSAMALKLMVPQAPASL